MLLCTFKVQIAGLCGTADLELDGNSTAAVLMYEMDIGVNKKPDTDES